MRGNFIYRRLGVCIYKWRKLLAVSQEDLASVSGVDRTLIGKMERGEANPSFRTLCKLAKALRISLSVFLSEM